MIEDSTLVDCIGTRSNVLEEGTSDKIMALSSTYLTHVIMFVYKRC